MKISVIIPVFNEERDIGRCIDSLSEQSYKDFEIVVVDDGSADNTLNIVNGYQFSITNFQLLKQIHKGTGAARNLGVAHSSGKILVFVDADMTFDKDFLKNLVSPIEEREVKGTWSREEYVANWNNVWARCWNIQEGWEEKRRHPKNYPNHQPVFRAILKSEFKKVGGFTSGGYDDDWSLSKKLGYEAENASGAIFYHKNPDSLWEVFQQAKWVGKRKYKFWLLGFLIALIRSSPPISIVVGLWKSVKTFNFYFFVFKLIYDFGVFTGILEFLFFGKASK